MELSVALGCLLIFVARIIDVSLGTLRTVSVINGRANWAWCFGFFEVLVWVFAVSHVVTNLNNPVFAISYALGYATGNYVGIIIEQHVAFGKQVVRVFTQSGESLAVALREFGYKVTEFDGRGRDGRVSLLFLEVARKEASKAVERAREVDSNCFVVVDDIRFSSAVMRQNGYTSTRIVMQRK